MVELIVPSIDDGDPPVTRPMTLVTDPEPRIVAVSPLDRLKAAKF